MKRRINFVRSVAACGFLVHLTACVPHVDTRVPEVPIPEQYAGTDMAHASKDSVKTASMNWKDYFADPNLIALIDTALENNQELNIFTQEIQITRNEIGAKQGAYLPSVELGADAGLDKVGRYTRQGAVEESLEIEPGKSFPDPLGDFALGAYARWEVDIWHKLRDAEKSAVSSYLATVEGKNFMVTNLIAEIASSYYELLALDNQLSILDRNIAIQQNALEVVRLKKQGARVTELALRRFEAQVFYTRSLKFEIEQKIVETENRINFLVGRYPQSIKRDATKFVDLIPASLKAGIPAQLIENRPDIRKAELELAAADLDVKVARANFYPSLDITGSFGLSAYDTSKLFETPESMLYSITGGLTAPFLNRKEIKAVYLNASAKQVQAVIEYERTVLQAFIEVANQLSNIEKLKGNYTLKQKQVKALDESVQISTTLFNSARADYMEVLLTQREAMDSKFELVETKVRQLNAAVNIYRSLGGGWRDSSKDVTVK